MRIFDATRTQKYLSCVATRPQQKKIWVTLSVHAERETHILPRGSGLSPEPPEAHRPQTTDEHLFGRLQGPPTKAGLQRRIRTPSVAAAGSRRPQLLQLGCRTCTSETPSKTLNFNEATRSPLSPHSHNQQRNGPGGGKNLHKAVLKKQHAAAAAAASMAMPPPPPPTQPQSSQRRPTREAPKAPGATTFQEPQPPLNASKRAAKDQRSGQKPVKRRRIDGSMPPPAPATAAVPSAPVASAVATDNEDTVPMDMDIPPPCRRMLPPPM